jgi:hypothetical protein
MRYRYQIDLYGYIVGYLETEQPLDYNKHTWSNNKLRLQLEDGVTVRSVTRVRDLPKTPDKESK